MPMRSRSPFAQNPFTPTFGRVPYMLAGRDELLDDIMGGLANQPGDPNRSSIFVGPRGSGKTVLLRTIAREASQQGWISVNVTARSGMYQEIFDGVRSAAFHLLTKETTHEITAVQLGPVGFEREAHARGLVSNRFKLQGIVEELNAQGVGLLFAIDEIDPSCEELIDFIATYQDFVGEERDVALLMAGLPGQVSSLLLNRSVSFVRRAFQWTLDPIDLFEVENALFETLVANGKEIDGDALEAAAEATRGFAFAVQLVGYYLWRECYNKKRIELADAQNAAQHMQGRLARAVVAPTLKELTMREIEYLMAMAQDDGPSATSDIAKRMGISMSNASNLRRRLIEHGVIGEVCMGVVDFDLPLFRKYLRDWDGNLRLC